MRLALALAILACLPAAYAQFGPQIKPPPNLEIGPPPDWQGGWEAVSDQSSDGKRHLVLRPASAAPDSVKRLLNVVMAPGGTNKSVVMSLAQDWATQVRKTCPEVNTVAAPLKSANDFWVGYLRLDCPKRSDTGEGSLDLVKIMVAEKQAFLIAIAERTPPFVVPKPGSIKYATQAEADAVGKWLKSMGSYLESIRACEFQTPMIKLCSP